ncbi:MAG: hypothetical protein GY698_08560, partial [Actinomycetia bacterium]|nr:hypothetical protein [Actinomycetes bacterium]
MTTIPWAAPISAAVVSTSVGATGGGQGLDWWCSPGPGVGPRIMEPTADTGVIADSLAARGEGLHHIAFAVDDLDDTMVTLGGKGVQFVADHPVRNRMPVMDHAGRRVDDDIQFTFSHPK